MIRARDVLRGNPKNSKCRHPAHVFLELVSWKKSELLDADLRQTRRMAPGRHGVPNHQNADFQVGVKSEIVSVCARRRSLCGFACPSVRWCALSPMPIASASPVGPALIPSLRETARGRAGCDEEWQLRGRIGPLKGQVCESLWRLGSPPGEVQYQSNELPRWESRRRRARNSHNFICDILR
jgi:hypothetical protein